MCGIVSTFAYSPEAPPVDREALRRVRERMAPRGPDGKGEWFSRDGRVGMGHRRLSIVDLSVNAAQPMTDETGNLVITFNGEIYNYKEIRRSLEAKGRRFRTRSDTEVLLNLYREKGREMVRDLRGMYAFAIWDEERQGLFVARDPFGIKPLYCSDDGRTFRAASQVKALLAGGGVDTSPDPAGHAGFFLWGHLPEPFTLYKGINAFPPGASLWLDSSGVRWEIRFMSVGELFDPEKAHPPSCGGGRTLLHDALLDSVKHHLIADVPVGLFLSSGLDSATLAALAAESGEGEIHTVTLGFDEYRGTERDEVPLAEEIARHYGTKHETVRMTKRDFTDEFDRLTDAMDQPTIDGINSYFVSLAARKAGLKAALSGVGGDELFGGYPSFTQVPDSVKRLGFFAAIPAAGKIFRKLSFPVIRQFTSPKYAGVLEYGGSFGGAYLLRRGLFMPWELPSLIGADMAKEGLAKLETLTRLDADVKGFDSDRVKISVLEMTWYMRNQLLRDADWAGMAHSLEIRVPFLDVELIRRLSPLLIGKGAATKKDMAVSLARVLPEAVLARRKTGFTVPVREWLSHDAPGCQERGLRGWAKQIFRLSQR